MKLNNKAAIITGAGQGIGLEICRKLIDAGANIILNDVDEKLVKKAEEEFGRKCQGVTGDASDIAVINEMIEKAINTFGRLDIAIANAGITLFGDFLNYNSDDFFEVLKVNLGGTFFLGQTAAKQMIKQKSGGSLLFMSSVTGHQAHKNLAAYGMTKAAIEMLAKSLVVELSEHKINVNTIAPGATMTERTAKDVEYEKVWAKITPMGRPAFTEDIANAALFLVSENARHITGQTIVVDGGWTSVSPSPY